MTGHQLSLFGLSSLLKLDHIQERIPWKEYHRNGQLWIDGEIGIISEGYKYLFNYRTGFEGYEGVPVCRLGLWSKYYDNGQIGWQIRYNDYGYCDGTKFPSYRKDGIGI